MTDSTDKLIDVAGSVMIAGVVINTVDKFNKRKRNLKRLCFKGETTWE